MFRLLLVIKLCFLFFVLFSNLQAKSMSPISLSDIEYLKNVEYYYGTHEQLETILNGNSEPQTMVAVYAEIPQLIRNRMIEGNTYREGCPVPLNDLRLVYMTHINEHGQPQVGEMIVHKNEVVNIIEVFQKLYDSRFPMKKMRLLHHYNGSDDASIAANNTAAFNCREVAGGSNFSWHAYGVAVDINPIQNPYLITRDNELITPFIDEFEDEYGQPGENSHIKDLGERLNRFLMLHLRYLRSLTFLPPTGKQYLNRELSDPRLISRGDFVYNAFADIGWEWGGDWPTTAYTSTGERRTVFVSDYQHFELRDKSGFSR